MNACLRAFAGSKRKRGLAVVLSDLYDTKGVIPALNSLRYQKFEVFVIHCVSPQETLPELFGDIRLLDSETQRFRDVTLTGKAMRRYREAFDEYCGTIERYCRSKAIGYVRCRTDMPFEDTVVRMLRHEKFMQ